MRQRLPFALPVVLAGVLAGASAAQKAPPDPAADLRAALAGLPVAVTAEGPGFSAGAPAAIDRLLQARAGAAEAEAAPDPVLIAELARSSMDPDLWSTFPDTWPQSLGFAISQVATITQAGAPPTEMRRITLLPGAAGPVPAALTATGYHEEPSDRGRLFAAGASEFAIDLGARRDDPFGGMLGRSSRILIEGDTLLQAAGMGPVMALSGGASWAARPDMAAILDALSSWPADPPGAAAWVNAHVLLRQSDLAPMPDIALLLDGAARPEPAPGVPFWSVCVIALLVGEGGTSSAIAIPYATREQAEAAARSALQGWQMPGPGGEGAKSATIGPLETRITGTGPFVMIAAVSGGAGWADAPRDIPYWQILRALWNRDLGEFGPPA